MCECVKLPVSCPFGKPSAKDMGLVHGADRGQWVVVGERRVQAY